MFDEIGRHLDSSFSAANVTSAIGALRNNQQRQKDLRAQSGLFQLQVQQQKDILQIKQILADQLSYAETLAEERSKRERLRDKLESKRFWLNTALSLQAAIAGLIALLK